MLLEWWLDFYDDLIGELVLESRSSAEVGQVVSFLMNKLGVSVGCKVFDQCCGIGTFSIPLAQRGISVWGVDCIESYVSKAKERAKGLDSFFEVGDAGEYVPPVKCDAGFCWGTSFGNAADHERNLDFFRRAWEALVPGGRYIVDYPNFARVLADFKTHIVRRYEHKSEDGLDTVLVRESKCDLENGFLLQRWTVFLPDGSRKVKDTSVRMYMPFQLGDMLSSVGFVGLEFYGDAAASPLSLDSLRCIVKAVKPPR